MTTPIPDSGEMATRPRSRGVYLLPNLFTTGVMFSGFYAIVAATDGNFDRAGIAIFIAMVCDGLDGRIARWTNTQSEFGKEFDSLSDMVAFGIAPAVVAYMWGVARIAEYGEVWPVAMSLTGNTCSIRSPDARNHGPRRERSAMSPMPQLRDERAEKSGSRRPARRPSVAWDMGLNNA